MNIFIQNNVYITVVGGTDQKKGCVINLMRFQKNSNSFFLVVVRIKFLYF